MSLKEDALIGTELISDVQVAVGICWLEDGQPLCISWCTADMIGQLAISPSLVWDRMSHQR